MRRITKREARKRFAAGEIVIFCPRKLRPGFPWCPESRLHGAEWVENYRILFPGRDAFEAALNQWAFYNASYETGYYPHYYTEAPT